MTDASSPSAFRARMIGVLAGGRGMRMGGRDKSRLPSPESGEALALRIVRLAREINLEPLLVGGKPLLGVPHLLDTPPGIGPIGGLCALLDHAQSCGEHAVLALACDLPRVDDALLERLSREAASASVLCPRDPLTGKWDPLFARYSVATVLPALRAAITRDTRSMQTVLRELDVTELSLRDDERAKLRDWDTPEDLA